MNLEIKFKPRLYQQSILKTALLKNTLIVLPTGLGKTKTAILISLERLRFYPNSKILFLTPTKPLANQIASEYKTSTNLEETGQKTRVFTGETPPESRQRLWDDSVIIVSTPQTISNDLINKRLSLKNVSLLVFDEAHRATGDYDYCWIAKEYIKTADLPRLIALTASPGSNFEDITKVCKNLFIDEIEVRTETDEDVSPYIQEMEIEWIKIDFPEEFITIKILLQEMLNSRLENLAEKKIIPGTGISKKELINAQAKIHGNLAKGWKDFSLLKSVSTIAESIKLHYAIELIETQSLNSLLLYLKKLLKEAEAGKIKASKNISHDPRFRQAYLEAEKLSEKNIQHPKLKHLIKIAKEQTQKNPKIKIIIFAQYRDSGKEIESALNNEPGIRAKLFVGQAKKNGTGLSQKKQLEILNSFRNNEYNIIIGTSVSEEGIDVPGVDLVIFYEPVPSAIRSIQRKGRTARLEKGKVIILMTKNTRDETYHWVSYHKEKNMNRILKNLKQNLEKPKQSTLGSFTPSAEPSTNLKIIVDSRENNKVLKFLQEKNIDIETKRLDIADYIISDDIAIELKTVPDFVASIIDKRIFHQVRELRNNFEKPILIIEGQEDIYSVRKVHPNAIRGMLATIISDFQVPIVCTKNPMDTAEFLIALAKREQSEKTKDFGVRIDKKPLTTKELQEFIIESLPGIGPNSAKSLLSNLKTVKNIINASEKELEKIENIGKKRAKDIKDIVDEKYSE